MAEIKSVTTLGIDEAIASLKALKAFQNSGDGLQSGAVAADTGLADRVSECIKKVAGALTESGANLPERVQEKIADMALNECFNDMGDSTIPKPHMTPLNKGAIPSMPRSDFSRPPESLFYPLVPTGPNRGMRL